MEKIDLPSANSFAVDKRLLLRSFMYIRKNSGPKIKPSGTPANIGEVHGLVMVTMKMLGHSKEHVEICHFRNF